MAEMSTNHTTAPTAPDETRNKQTETAQANTDQASNSSKLRAEKLVSNSSKTTGTFLRSALRVLPRQASHRAPVEARKTAWEFPCAVHWLTDKHTPSGILRLGHDSTPPQPMLNMRHHRLNHALTR